MDWTRLAYAFAEYRFSPRVEAEDVQQADTVNINQKCFFQAARHLLNIDCPPVVVEYWRHLTSSSNSLEEAIKNFAFSLIATGSSENVQHGMHLLQDRPNGTNIFVSSWLKK